MASNTTTLMEDKHFDSMGNNDVKVSNKDATKDFINTETGKYNFNKEIPAQASTNLPNKGDSANVTVYDFHSIGSGLESDIEDNSNTNPVEVPSSNQQETNIDNNLPSTVTLLRTPEGGKCYLIGTAHFSIESQNDVSKVIQAVQPHVVMVELCRDRIHILQMDEETILKEVENLSLKNMLDIIKENGTYKGIFHLLLLSMSAHLTRVLGLAPGGEFRTALAEVKKIPNCLLQLGDRPIKITVARALSSLSWWQTIKLTWLFLTERGPISQKDIEKCKSQDSLQVMMAEMQREYPVLGEVFVKERDIFLTYSLQLETKPRIGLDGRITPARVVGVVGVGHTLGIIENWGKVKRSQIPPIMSVPPPSLSSKILKFTIKVTVIGVVMYVGYKVADTVKSSLEKHIQIPFGFDSFKVRW